MSKKKDKPFERCYEKHPELKFTDKLKITGGSCVSPYDGYDIYVGLDLGMSVSDQSFPWVEGDEFLFPIRDQDVPNKIAEFKELVTWLIVQLKDGKKIHVGCIGGHGRTGLVFSAMYAEITGKKDAIQFVRKHYCDKAVESKKQIKFLMQHYGVDTAESRSYASTYSSEPISDIGWSKNETYDYNKYFPDSTLGNTGISKDGYFKYSDYDNITITPRNKKRAKFVK